MVPSISNSNVHNITTSLEYNFYSKQQITCLANNIYHEARNQPLIGKLAVAQVTINRVKSSKFPDTICQVVYQAKLSSNGNPILKKCQFSWYCDGKSDAIINKKLYEEIYKLAEDFLIATSIDITEGSTYYHSNKVKPYWAKHFTKIVTIEDHIFYKG